MAEEEEKTDKRIGNDFWKHHSKHGRDKIFTTPEILWEASCEYFEWVKENPLMETIIQGNKEWQVPKMRAMTIEGLCIFLDVGSKTFYNYCSDENDSYKAFIHITTQIKHIIRTQKFEGASAGFLNANIIARDLGLADKKEVTTTEEPPDYSALDTKEKLQLHALLKKSKDGQSSGSGD